jgi:hypothetical protein
MYSRWGDGMTIRLDSNLPDRNERELIRRIAKIIQALLAFFASELRINKIISFY